MYKLLKWFVKDPEQLPSTDQSRCRASSLSCRFAGISYSSIAFLMALS
jgi:hypothetical protein